MSMSMKQYVLSQVGRCKHLNQVKQVQAFLVSRGHAQSQLFAFKLVRLCAVSLGDLRYARSMFDHLSSPNVYLYAAMVTAYASLPDHPSALSLFRLMLRRAHSRPNHFVYPQLLKSSPPLSTASLHAHILKSGFAQYPVVQTALVHSHSRTSSGFPIARQVFDEMHHRHVVSWTAMISAYTRIGDVQEALSLFWEMPHKDVPSWNSVIAGCAQNGFFSDAIALFHTMLALSTSQPAAHNRPNGVTVVCVLSACTHAGILNVGKAVHAYVYRNGLDLDSFIGNAMVDMYGKCGRLKEATRVFNMIPTKSLTSWNSMINCFALHGESENAISVFEEMIRCGGKVNVRPNLVTFVALLNACVHGGLVAQGLSYFTLMTSGYEIEPRIEHYGCLIDLLARTGRFEEALEVIRGMRMEPDEAVWGCLFNGSKIHGRADLAELAAKKLVEIDPNNGSYGTMLVNIYGELGDWDGVCKMRKMMKKQNAYKTPGCSWVEVDNQVHQFYCFDQTHTRSEEIYNILEILGLE